MERLTARNERFPDETYYPYCFREDTCRGEGMSDKCDMCELPYKICKKLADYEDTGLTPEKIMELKEAVHRLDKIFGDEITVDQVIDFFVDFYIAQGDPDRVEAAELLTNEEVTRYRELKEWDTAKAPNKKLRHRGGFETFHCPNCDTSYQMDRRYTITDEYCPKCGKLLDSSFRSFCANCGQRLEEGR